MKDRKIQYLNIAGHRIHKNWINLLIGLVLAVPAGIIAWQGGTALRPFIQDTAIGQVLAWIFALVFFFFVAVLLDLILGILFGEAEAD